jgi:hypothetical protein
LIDATVAVLADGLVDAAIKGYVLLKIVGEPESVRRLQGLREATFRRPSGAPPQGE